jgi:hypothetical protein
MVESTRPVRSRDSFEKFDEAISDPRLYETNQVQYEPPQYEHPYALPYERSDTLQDELPPHEPVPLFLSNYEEESHQQLSEYNSGYTFASGSRKKTGVSRIVTGLVAVAAIGVLLALFSIDSTRAVIFNASLGGVAPVQLGAAAAPEPAQPPQRIAAPPIAEPPAPEVTAARRTPANALASASPTRDEIAAAYQSAIKGKVAVSEPVAREAAREVAPVTPAIQEAVPVTREAVPARRIDRDELAALLKRAKGLLAIGDISSARLLLERAADAQEAEAALMLAGTYDPQVLGSQDMRSVTPDPAAARLWYQKAAQLGSADAKRRLGQLQN